MPDVFVKIDPIPAKDRSGVSLDIGVCYATKGKGEKCEMVDRLVFDKKDIERGVPQKVMGMLQKSISGEYWEQGCKHFKLPMKGGRCGKAGVAYQYTPPPEKKTEAPKKKGGK